MFFVLFWQPTVATSFEVFSLDIICANIYNGMTTIEKYESNYRISATQICWNNIDAHILKQILYDLLFIISSDVYFLFSLFRQERLDELIAEISKIANIDSKEFILSLHTIFFTILNILFGDGPLKITFANAVNISNNIELRDVPPHFFGHIDFQKIHIILAILIAIHLIDKHILGQIQYNRPALIIFPQIIKYLHFMKLLKIFPFVLLLHHLMPLKVLLYLLAAFLELIISSDHETTDQRFMLCAVLFF